MGKLVYIAVLNPVIYLCASKWYTSAHAMTPLHGGATSGLQIMTHPH